MPDFVLWAAIYGVVIGICHAVNHLADELGRLFKVQKSITTNREFFDIGLYIMRDDPLWLDYSFLPDILCVEFFCIALVSWQGENSLDRAVILIQIHIIGLVMRAFSCIATLHRASPRCLIRYGKPKQDGFANTCVMDMMFSGHALFSTILLFSLLFNPSLSIGQKFLSFLLGQFCIWSNVLVGDHYTSDILISQYIGGLLFCVYRQDWLNTFIE